MSLHRQSARSGSQSGLSRTGASSEWDIVEENYSHGSLESEESDAVVIFGGPGKVQQGGSGNSSVSGRSVGGRSNGSAASASALGMLHTSHSGVLSQDIHMEGSSPSHGDDSLKKSSLLDSKNEPWQQKHQRLLSAVSDLASDPGLSRVTADLYGGMEQSLPIEQRLLDQIARLAEELDESQEQAKLLLLQNDRLMTENDELKQNVRDVLGRSNDAQGQSSKDEEPDIMRMSVAVAAGLVLIGLTKKRLVFDGVGILGAAMIGGCFGLYRYVNRVEGR